MTSLIGPGSNKQTILTCTECDDEEQMPCPDCSGIGRVQACSWADDEDEGIPCDTCGGEGRVRCVACT